MVSTVICLKNDLIVVQVDVVDSANGADVEGVGDARGLLGEDHGHVRLHVVDIAVKDRLGNGAVGVLLLGAVRGGIALTGDVELTVADADEDLVDDGGAGKVSAVVACGVEKVHGLESELALLGSGQVTACVMGGILGLDTAVSLQYDVILGGEVRAGLTKDVGQVDGVIAGGLVTANLHNVHVPVGVGDDGGIRQIDLHGGRDTHVLADALCSKASLTGSNLDDHVTGEGLQTGDGGHIAAVLIGGEHDVGADDLGARSVLPVDRPVHFLILGGLGQNGSGQDMLQDVTVGGSASHGLGRQRHEGRVLGLNREGRGVLDGFGVGILAETVRIAGHEGEGGKRHHGDQQNGQILLEILLHRVIPPLINS